MRRHYLLASPAALVLTVVCSHQAVAQAVSSVPARDAASGRPVLVAGAGSAIQLDGLMNEAAWDGADSITTLTQTEPREGSPASARTVVKVLATENAITIGVRAEQPPGVPVISFARARDASLNNEDHVRVVFDTYMDGRSGYVFAVNANGARYDALVADQGEGERSDWDGIWEAATARMPSGGGWSAEIRIPLKTLLFRQDLTEWGFNVQRRIQALLETDRWASPLRQFRLTHVNRAGVLGGLPPFRLGLGLSVRPSVAGGAGRTSPASGTRSDADVSLDATQRIRANTLASLTLNTDFGETEVDTRRTNLTRFPLFFPEKRTFFLEGSDIFEFGLGTGSDVRAFHSRRVGLLSQREVPLRTGVKLSGREQGTNFGALVVRTGQADDPLLDTLPTANTMAVLRVQQNVLRQSSVGMIATLGDPLGAKDAWLAGPDLTYQTSRFLGDKNFLAGAWVLAMDRAGLTGRKRAWGAKLDYPNDLLDIALTYKWLGDGFQPSLGFVPRPGVQILNFNVVHQPRPTRPILGLRVRQMLNESLNTLVTDLSGRWESYRLFIAPVNWRLESGDRFEINANPTGERLTVPFEIADGVIIPAGSYHWYRYRLEAGFASKRRLSGQATWWFGRFYTGKLDEFIATAAWKPSPLFIVELNGTRNVGRLPQGNFTQQVAGTRFLLNVSPDLQMSSLVQYDDESRLLGTNTRVRWTFSPMGDLFVVYNHNVRESLDALSARSGYRFDSNQLLVKLQYAFRY
jgi:hypothetical protein